MHSIEIKAPAKVNTLLRVKGKRPDGYHNLEMVMVPLSLADTIEISADTSRIELKVEGECDKGMVGEKNLAYRAAMALREAAGVGVGATIRLRKHIPVAAGLGGGSSDAAAVLKGLNNLWHLDWPVEKIADIGAKLGADVPFFCHGRLSYVEGTGDLVTPYESFPNLLFLLVNPSFAVPTSWVYKQWDLQRGLSEAEGHAPSETEGHALSRIEGLTHSGQDATRARPLFETFSDIALSLHNDLEAVTIPAYPEIAEIKRALLDAGAIGSLMSGSGPTVFGIFRDEGVRGRAYKNLARMNERWRVIATETVGTAVGT